MNGRSLPLLPLGILALLVALTFWLSRFVQPGITHADGKARHDPDLIVEKFAARKLSPTGDIQYTLHASKMVHFPDDDSSLLDNIRLVAVQPDEPQITARSPRGRMRNGSDEVVMEGGVLVESEAGKNSPPLKLNTPKLTMLPKENLAKSKDGVTVLSETGQLVAARFQLDTKTRRIVFEKAKVTYRNPKTQ
jgi:lipopolysaccharide export system protein LptC